MSKNNGKRKAWREGQRRVAARGVLLAMQSQRFGIRWRLALKILFRSDLRKLRRRSAYMG